MYGSLMRHLILFALSLIFSASSYALTVNVLIKGGNITYENARVDASVPGVTTSSEIFSNLEPTKKWMPATTKVTKDITLTGSSSNQSTTAQVIIHGLEYDWGSISNASVSNNILGLENSVCNTSVTSNLISVVNSSQVSCISNKAIISSKDNIPFYFVRPIFEIKNLLMAFKGKSEGIYVGSLEVPVRYYFYNSMSVLTYRELSFNLTFQVNYLPEVFTSLVVTPENGGVMPPQYGSGTVKGETRFNIETLGYFNSGIKMKFDTSKDYSLTHDTQTEKKIPYYVHCDTCEDKVIVGDKGKVTTSVLNNAGVVLAPVGSDKTRINYNLTVGYSDKTVNEVVTGGYSDSFVVIFGLDF